MVPDMDYRSLEERIRRQYNRSYSKRYRIRDDTEVTTEDHAHHCSLLRSLTTTFDHEISVLDIGCGTGLFFHCLRNTKKLVGIDVSPYMLEEAKDPAKRSEIIVEDIELRCGNIFDIELPQRSFELVYSIGVLGNHSPFDLFVCAKIHRLLRQNGVFFFTVVDISSKRQRKSMRRKVAEFVYPVLPRAARTRLDKRWQYFYMTREELEDVMNRSPFHEYEIERTVSSSPTWKGAYYECIARKAD
jgi:SAM-dependent methyltransferase